METGTCEEREFFSYQIDRMGCMLIWPESESLKVALRKHMLDFGIELDERAPALVQNDLDIEKIQEEWSDEEREDYDQGWEVTRPEDPWVTLHYWGWDAHTLAESGWEK